MKNFIKIVFASLTALVLFSLVVVMFIAVLLSIKEVSPPVEEKTLLTLDLRVPISDREPKQAFASALSDVLQEQESGRQTLRVVVAAIRKAAADDRISGLFIRGNVVRDGYHSGWAALQEVRDAIAEFRAKGKPVLTWQEELDEATLFVVSSADEIVFNPLGNLEFNGFAAEVMYFKEAFEKYGLEAQVTRVGKYKSAVEPFLRSDMSEENREQLEALLGDLFDVVVAGIAKHRGIPEHQLRELSQGKGIIGAEEARAQGYVTALGYYDEVLEKLRKLTGTDSGKKIERQLTVNQYFTTLSQDEEKAGKVAVIYAEGEIVSGDDDEEVGGDKLARLLRKAREDEKVKAVVLRVNSPGGSASASEVIQRETRLLSQSKPLIVSMGSVAASGGYWISAYADEIYAQPSTITGSIGVFGLFLNIKKLINEHGLNVEVARTSRYADLFSLYRPKTESELAVIQQFVDRIYEQFIAKVAEGRKIEKSAVQEIAQGRVWSGRSALKLGLVDKLGGLEDAIAAAAKQAGLADEYRVEEYQKGKDLMESLLEQMGMMPEPTARLPLMGSLWQRLKLLLSITDSRGFYARMPYDLEIR